MRRIALLSDVHGNLPALEAVIEDFSHREIDEVWNLGDFLGYAPFPNEVVQTFRQTKAVSIIGNYDLKVLAFKKKQNKWEHKKIPEKYLAFEWNYDHLSEDTTAYLESLPQQTRVQVGALTALLVHGSPDSIDEHLGSATPRARFEEMATDWDADLIVCGHSHEPFAKKVKGTWFVNPGSVGRPEGGDQRASYAILEIEGKELKAEHKRVRYDIDRVAQAVREADLPESFVDVFRTAQSLDRLENRASGASGAVHNAMIASGQVLEAVLALARVCHFEAEHTEQVTRLALEIFDGLAGMHKMGPEERSLLQYGSLLHDIGWIEGQQGHHKAALRRIIAEPKLPLRTREREIIGLIARYHRKALPDKRHKYFRSLSADDQHRVRVLAGILRVADGLDRNHQGIIQAVHCGLSAREITFSCQASGPADDELEAARSKADLLSSVFGRQCAFSVSLRTE
jgi:putative phosphoesterase